MQVLVLNCGSSSVKAAVISATTGERKIAGRVTRIGEANAQLSLDEGEPRAIGAADHAASLAQLLPAMLAGLDGRVPGAVGHRVVHGGERFTSPTLIDDEVVDTIRALVPLAPLHNPAALAGIQAARALLPTLPHVAVFDTAFHATLPPEARTYALPLELSQAHGLRRYGFHGSSHRWVARQAAAHMQADLRELRLITCHLGNGCSAAAVAHGHVVDTTMGMTPLEGLVMGTRSGDVDPGLLLALQRDHDMTVAELDDLLNQHSGLAGLSGVGNDLRDIEARATVGDARCRLAIQVFVHRLRRTIGALAAVMGGVDAVVFTGGIGENSALVRSRSCQRMTWLGAHLDEDRNHDARVSSAEPVRTISAPHSRVRLLVAASDEARSIAEQTVTLLSRGDAAELTIPVAISARHVHLTQAAVEQLFGPGHQLTVYKPLSQPGGFAAQETVDIVGPRRTLHGVRVIGPCRSRCQVEVSRTDEFYLGVDAPVRVSGDLDGTPGITLAGPATTLELQEGLICARRHIHASPDEAAQLGLSDGDEAEVVLDTQGRDLVFGDVKVRVSPHVHLEMHLDTDEGNAAEIVPGDAGVLAPTGVIARLRHRHTRFDER